MATGIDAVFDIGSNVLLFWLHRKATNLDMNKWPVGGARLENIGNIVYGQQLAQIGMNVLANLLLARRFLVSYTIPTLTRLT